MSGHEVAVDVYYERSLPTVRDRSELKNTELCDAVRYDTCSFGRHKDCGSVGPCGETITRKIAPSFLLDVGKFVSSCSGITNDVDYMRANGAPAGG